MTERRFVRPALLTSALAISLASLAVGSASAAATQIRMPVAFTLTPARCPDLQVTFSGSGDSFLVINDHVDQQGVDHINMNNVINGTATDTEGGSYVFGYHNHASVDVAPGGFPMELFLTDHFNLNGRGKANQVHVGFVARLTFTGPAEPPIVEIVNLRGNPMACDAF